jgi:hypothetical protein
MIHQLHLLDPVYHLLVLVHKVPIRSILAGRNLPRDHQHQQIASQLNQPMYPTLWQLHIHKTMRFLTVSM